MFQLAMDSPSGVDTKADPQGTSPTYISPYSKIIALHFSDQVLHVHQFQLKKSHELSVAAAKHDTIDLSEFSGITGHILVNYLYSGAYKTLIDDKDNGPALDTLRVNFEVYALAKGRFLPELRDMAQAAIENQSDDLDPAPALAFIKKACPLFSAEELWLRDLTRSLLEKTYSDVASFLASDLMAPDTAGGTMSFTEMLLRSVISSVTAREMKQAKEREAREKLERDRDEALHVEHAAQKEAGREKLKVLYAEREELEGKKRKRGGKLLKAQSARLAKVYDEISILAGGQAEPHADGDQPWPEPRPEPGWEPELFTAVDLAKSAARLGDEATNTKKATSLWTISSAQDDRTTRTDFGF